MRFGRDPNSEKTKRLLKWHIWFAWYPVRIKSRIFWLESVYRILEHYPRAIAGVPKWKWAYCAIPAEHQQTKEK